MKKIKFLCMASVAALMLGACSDDKLADGPEAPVTPGSPEDGVFFALNISMPNNVGGRSETVTPGENGSASNNGVEYGKDYENTISEAIVVLAEQTTHNFIAAASITSAGLYVNDVNKSSYTAKSKFSKTVLNEYYASLATPATEPIKTNIFLFCNPTQELRDVFFATTPVAKMGENKWVDAVGTVSTSSPIWTPNYFLMSNALIATRQIPATADEWNNFTKEDNPFNLSGNNTVGDGEIDNSSDSQTIPGGPIKVERTAARFDFRDGSSSETEPFTYHVVYTDANNTAIPEDQKTPLIDITLQKMSMVNVGMKYYFLPHMVGAVQEGRVADIDPAKFVAGICKAEQPWVSNAQGDIVAPYGNYVLDADYQWKNDMLTLTSGFNFNNNLLYPFFNEDGTIDNTNVSSDHWATSVCSEVVGGTTDTDDSWNSDKKFAEYHIWRYATENTIPSVDGQVNGVTTGVVFKGQMKATDQALKSEDADVKTMAQVINNVADKKLSGSYTDPILYQFEGGLYMSWENVRKAAISAANPTFKWVPTPTEDDLAAGHWELETINRTNSLYVAVFGQGGVGEFTFKFNQEGSTEQGTATIKDVIDPSDNCANAAWTAWDKAGRPAPGKEETDALVDAFKSAVTEAGFTIYQSSYDPKFGWGYYCYYYYWNRHNFNGNDGVMGPMEFAVVRNNVYKLAVTKIKQLGHPRISANDPNKPKPGTPDEKEDVYLTVDAQVLPWVVRVNDIEF